MTGFRTAFVFAVISGAATIHWWISSADSFEPTPSRAPFALPFPAMEWQIEHFCAAWTASPRFTSAASCADEAVKGEGP